MTRQYHLESVLLPHGFAQNVRVTVAEDGYISAIELGPTGPGLDARGGAPTQPERIRGIVVPGMPNAHSHAFQRGMNGNTEYRLSARDSFWTWRQAMYALANRIQPADLQILATQLFVEMLKAGYTSVAEFHYLHRQPDGENYPGDNALWAATAQAAAVRLHWLILPPKAPPSRRTYERRQWSLTQEGHKKHHQPSCRSSFRAVQGLRQ